MRSMARPTRNASRLLGWALATACAGPGAVTAGAPPASVPGVGQAFVDAHNRHRAKHCAPPLRWSSEVAESAQRWADGLARRGCILDHSHGRYGENLASGTPGYLGPEAVVEMWYGEARDYSYRRPGFSPATGHFTQVVWVRSASLGCGFAPCDDSEVWVCQYDPPGNFLGAFEQNVLPESCHR
jgi:uncharacterized protein YkwD